MAMTYSMCFSIPGTERPRKYPVKRHAGDPADTAGNVEQGKAAVFHFCNARHHRGERAGERHEPGQDNGDSAVAIVELFGFDQVVAAEETALRSVIEGMTRLGADEVAGGIPADGSNDQQDVQQHDVKLPACGEQPSSDQKGVPRKEEADEKTGFCRK